MQRAHRNIAFVAVLGAGSGWLGVGLNELTGNTEPPMASLGALVWLILPALGGIALRLFGKDGWRDAGFRLLLPSSWPAYLVAIFVYPAAGLLSLALAMLLGVIDLSGFATKGMGEYAAAAGAVFAGSLIKNIFEEFAWRGYLTPRLEAARVHPLLNHLIVGIIWWSWHLPYYYFFLDPIVLENAIGTSIPVFIATALVVLFPTSILFGELRLLGKSVWPAFLLHCVMNALSMPLLMNGFMRVDGTLGTILSPTNEGLVTSLFLGAAGLLLYRQRRARASAEP